MRLLKRQHSEPTPLLVREDVPQVPQPEQPDDVALSFENVSKLYRAAARAKRLGAGRTEPLLEGETARAVWALRNVTFTVPRGRAVGVVGPNGSGKTTLVKVLARLTPLTSGRVVLRGRIAPPLTLASMLMNTEATGRQNVFLLSRFLGLPREAAERSMTDIVEFAELERVIDLEVKRYSRGQGVRLAFSLMLNLESDILIADEVLSGGDSGFRAKCLERVEERVRSGKTLLFASHDLTLVRRLCQEAVVLDRGEVVAYGPVDEVTAKSDSGPDGRTRGKRGPADRGKGAREPGPPKEARDGLAGPTRKVSFTSEAALAGGGVYSMDGYPIELLNFVDDALLELTIEAATRDFDLRAVIVLELDGAPPIRLVQPDAFRVERPGLYTAAVHVPGHLLPEGHYRGRLGAWIIRDGDEKSIVKPDAFSFEVFAIAGAPGLDEELENEEEDDDDGDFDMPDEAFDDSFDDSVDVMDGRLAQYEVHRARTVIEIDDLAWTVRRGVRA